MKEELVRYTCDQCKNTITVKPNNYIDTPLHYNWIRMYKLMHPEAKEKTKLHFCCDNCASKFLEDYLV